MLARSAEPRDRRDCRQDRLRLRDRRPRARHTGIETAQRMMMALRGSPTLPVRVPDVARAGSSARSTPAPRRSWSPASRTRHRRRLAGFATYGPEGRRGLGVAIARAARWGRDAAPYLGRWRKGGGLILQIESPAGLAAAAEMAATPGSPSSSSGPRIIPPASAPASTIRASRGRPQGRGVARAAGRRRAPSPSPARLRRSRGHGLHPCPRRNRHLAARHRSTPSCPSRKELE